MDDFGGHGGPASLMYNDPADMPSVKQDDVVKSLGPMPQFILVHADQCANCVYSASKTHNYRIRSRHWQLGPVRHVHQLVF